RRACGRRAGRRSRSWSQPLSLTVEPGWHTVQVNTYKNSTTWRDGMSGGKSAALPNRDAALRGLYDDVARGNMFPFWATSTDVQHDEIKQLMGTKKAVPFMWDYAKDIDPLLHRAAELIKMDDSERRSLILINPGLAPRRATVSTMYTAYRLNDPDEIMPP